MAGGQGVGAPLRVFLSYRRQDAAFQADTLYRALAAAFGQEHVFKDVDSIDPGDDFSLAIERAVTSCTVLLAIIGDRWLGAVDPAGQRRLDDPGDLVRLELESALRAGVRVVPVLLDVDPPAPDQLPASLAALPSRQAVFLSAHGFMSGVQRLVEQLARLGGAGTSEVQPAASKPDPPRPVPAEPEPATSAYRMQVADIAPAELGGRDAELRRLAEFCTGDQPYTWWQAEAWAGKTALLAWFALHPPSGVDIVAFFVVGGLAGQCDSDAFLEAVSEQLTLLAGRSPGSPATTAVRRGRLLELLAAAAERGRAAGRSLVLVVDGLDEDTSVATGRQSIASLLPRRPLAGVRIVVTSRPERELPADVPADHPLAGCRPVRMAPFDGAHDVQRFAQRELTTQLGGDTLPERLLGLLAASGGGLDADDLAQLTGAPPDAVTDLLRGGLGRCVRGRRRRLAGASGGGRGYLFAHDTLRQLAERELGSRLPGCRDRLQEWATGYRDRGWPAGTPPYLLHDYPRMLAKAGQVGPLSALAGDRRRHDRMLELTGGDALALDETALAQAAVLARHPPDLVAAAALALRRTELIRGNTLVPVGLAAVWAALGDTARAESLARGAAGAGRRGMALADAAQAAAAIGNLADAETLLRHIEDAERRDRALAAVAAEATTMDLAQADRLAAGLRDADRREAVHLGIAAARAAADPARTAELLPELTDGRAGRARTELAVTLARAGRAGEAEAVVAGAGPGRRGLPAPALARICGAMAAAGAVAAAERVAAAVRPPLIRARAVADVLAAAAAAGDAGTATRLLTELRAVALRVTDRRAACDLVLALAPVLVNPVSLRDAIAELAEELLAAAPTDQDWVAGRRLIARALAGDPADTDTALPGLGDPDAIARTARELALLAEAEDRPERTTALVAAIPDARRRAEVCTALARAAAGRGDRGRAIRLARAAERTARGSTDAARLAAAADHVVDGLILLGALDDAGALADRIAEPERRESARGRIAAALAAAGRVPEARARADRLAPTRRVWALVGVARRLAHTGAEDAALAAVEETLALLGQIPDSFARTAVRLRLARVLAGLGAASTARSLLRDAAREADAMAAPDRQARALVPLAVLAGELGLPEWSADLHRRAAAALHTVAEGSVRSRVHARLAEGLAETGHGGAAEEQLGRVTGPAARVRALCAVAAAGDPAAAEAWLAEAAALVTAIEPVDDRPPALARLAVTAAAAARDAGRSPVPEWAVRPAAELLAGETWSLAAPALAHLAPDACRLLASWVVDQLTDTGE